MLEWEEGTMLLVEPSFLEQAWNDQNLLNRSLSLLNYIQYHLPEGLLCWSPHLPSSV